MERDGVVRSQTLWLDGAGEVFVSLSADGLSWKLVDSGHPDSSAFSHLCVDLRKKMETGVINLSTVYSVELIDRGFVRSSTWNLKWLDSGRSSEMHRFALHGYNKGEVCHTAWVLSSYVFGHEDLQTCQTWVEQLNSLVRMQIGRPKNLLVFVHPLCGKGNGLNTWEMVSPIFCQAQVKTKVIVTKRAGHAFDTIISSADEELASFDGVVVVGGDGLFNEILNGLLSSRYKSPYPLVSGGSNHAESLNGNHGHGNNNCSTDASLDDTNDSCPSCKNDDQEPLLSKNPDPSVSGIMNSYQGRVLSFPNDWFRIGIIPSGSTDAIVISTTGMRDAVTSALQIVLGKKVPLDIAEVVRWKAQPTSMDAPYVRYAASFAGYGFYGDVIRESEKYRWMGPTRYDFAGTKMFLKHRSYEAEVAFLENKSIEKTIESENMERSSCRNPTKRICLANCAVCNEPTSSGSAPINGINSIPSMSDTSAADARWVRSKGNYLSVGAAVIPCRNERAPDGLVADAHLADGFLHLILIKDCPRPLYLWHLIQLTRRGSEPLNYRFVEHHKTSEFTFNSSHDESVWNLDGELLQASKVSVRACRGLINLFASGPEM